MTFSQYPNTRMRRNRSHEFSRRLVAENTLTRDDLVYPVFLFDAEKGAETIPSMPGIERHSLSSLMEVAGACVRQKIPALALFPKISSEKKHEDAREAYDENALIPRALKLLKKEFPHLGVIVDIALDPYTPHGQDGLLDSSGRILNDETISILSKQALCYAYAGADVIAPSDMMDGRIGQIRESLESHGFLDTKILSYAAKYASSLYSPFREAVGSVKLGASLDKKTYQMDPANLQEALHEASLDIAEGADMIMVKPAMLYCDVIRTLKDQLAKPTFAYQVSGEFAMIRSVCQANGLKESEWILESLLCLKRAGADAIFSYFALEAASWLP